MSLRVTKHQTPRNVTPRHDPGLDAYASSIERDRTPARPLFKHERYSRVQNKQAFAENWEHIFGARTVDDVKRRTGRTRIVYS